MAFVSITFRCEPEKGFIISFSALALSGQGFSVVCKRVFWEDIAVRLS
jgi:hypothetical protein